jgi:hypothetical protein
MRMGHPSETVGNAAVFGNAEDLPATAPASVAT